MKLETDLIMRIQENFIKTDNNLAARINVFYRFSNKGIAYRAIGEDNIDKLSRDLRNSVDKVDKKTAFEILKLTDDIDAFLVAEKLTTR